MPNRPLRLDRLFQEIQAPLWFLTFNTFRRAPLLANAAVHERFLEFCDRAADRQIFIGRYVIMPDHVHLFVAGSRDFKLSPWVRLLKLSLSSALGATRPHWQEGFFDHLLRNGENYSQKWAYVRQNPVRAGFVAAAEIWPYQGEVAPLPFD